MASMADSPEAADPFAAALRSAIRKRGLSLERVRFHLAKRGHDLSIATLSYWQSGRSRPERAASLAALDDLEQVLSVPTGSLSGPLRVARGRAAWPPAPVGAVQAAPPAESDRPFPVDDGVWLDEVETRGRLAAQLGLSFDDAVRRVSVQEVVEVRPDRSVGRRRLREVVRSQDEFVRRVLVSALCRSNGAPQLVVGESNCHAVQMLDSASGGLVVAELGLDAPLVAGEAAIIEYRVDPLGVTRPSNGVERTLCSEVDLYVFDLRFPANDPPVAITVSGWRAGRQVVEQVPVAGEHQVVALEKVGEGCVSASWCW